MANVGQNTHRDPSGRPMRHNARPSIDTNASGLAESTISFSAFPPPPIEIPTTPLRGGFSTPSPIRTNLSPIHPLVPRKGSSRTMDTGHSAPSMSSKPSSIASQSTSRPTAPAPPKPFSAHDWHDGSSSIDNVDPAEARLLSTSFITSLLQENKETRRANRESFASDAFSGISELTYPPPGPVRPDTSRRPLQARGGARPNAAARAPPSAFNPARHPNTRISADSDTLHSTQGYSGISRSTAASPPVVVGVASATLQSIPPRPHSTQTFPMSVDEKTVAYGFSSQDMDDDSILRFKAQTDGAPAPDPVPPPDATHRRPNLNSNASPQARQSAYSTRSMAPSFISRISSLRRMFNWQKKPLPPVPRIPDISLAAEQQWRAADVAAPLPDLVNRADTLHHMLENGRYAHQSIGSSYHGVQVASQYQEPPDPYRDQYDGTANSRQPLRPLYYSDFAERPYDNDKPSLVFTNQGSQEVPRQSCIPSLSKRTKIGISIFVTAIVAGIIAAVVVVVKRKQDSVPDCGPGITGMACNLNSTCVCTSSDTRCNPLAQNLIDLIPSLNSVFSSDFTPNDVYNSLWYVQGAMPRNDCSPQSLLVDVGKQLNAATYPNRTLWAQTAMLWNVIRSQDLESATSMSAFVRGVPWKGLTEDGAIASDDGSFIGTFSGHIFNFAAQTVTYPTASFVSQGQPTAEQIARVGTTAQAVLDRIYTSATAASNQQDVALRNYWTTTLLQRSSDLASFKSLWRSSPILLPFNASLPSIRTLFSNSSSSLFPPPLSCYPGLSSQHRDGINSLETSVFQLPASTSTNSFDTECYAERPVYGILDVPRLRLPFLDSQTGLPRQASILRTEAAPRAIVYSGAMLSSTFPNATAPPAFNSMQLNPSRFGTFPFANHVILDYLTSMPVETATALVEHVLGNGKRAPVPPEPSSSLFKALASIPVLEVAVFGNIGPPDISGTVSAFTTNSGSMFYGSAAGETFRRWSIASYGGSVQWAENATAPRVVKDASFEDPTLNETWKATSDSIERGSTGIFRSLVASLESTGKFSV